MQITYNGDIPVEIIGHDFVKPGATIEVPDEVGERLLLAARSTSIWATARSRSSRRRSRCGRPPARRRRSPLRSLRSSSRLRPGRSRSHDHCCRLGVVRRVRGGIDAWYVDNADVRVGTGVVDPRHRGRPDCQLCDEVHVSGSSAGATG